MKKFIWALALCFACGNFAQADLVITEFMADSFAVPDEEGEYFELYNSGPSAIDVGDLTIRDDGSDSLDLTSFAGTFISAGDFLVFGNEPTANAAHVDVDYSSIGNFTLANGADEIVILNTATSTELARLNYNNGDAPGDGIANVLNDIANATGGVTLFLDYSGEIAANNTLANGDIGSPGVAGSTNISSVPEPTMAVLFSLAGLGLCVVRRRS
ncbi:MAG: lamin tail domain-containing protein [Mariniblastus sp.]